MQLPATIRLFLLVLFTLLNPCVIKKNLLSFTQTELQQQFKHNSNNLNTCTVISADKLVSNPKHYHSQKYTDTASYQLLISKTSSSHQYRLQESDYLILTDKLYLSYCRLKIPS